MTLATKRSNSDRRGRDSRPSDRSRVELAAEAWSRVQAIAHDSRILAGTRALMEEARVSLPVVKALRQVPVDEPVAMRTLAARLRCDNSYVTSVVDALEAHQLAHRTPHPTDRRIKVVVLTDAGRALARRAQEMVARPPASFAALSDAELATFCRLLRKLDPPADASPR